MVKHYIAAAALMMCACSPGTRGAPPPSAPSALQGASAPEFKRQTLDGSMLDTKALSGRVRVVKFFAEYCEPCKRSLPEAQALHRRYDDVVFIGISEDERQTSAEAMVQAYGLSFPVLMDRGNALAGRFRVAHLPMTFVIDAQGTVAWVGGPGHEPHALEKVLRSMLAES